jgi:hypothetical protein
MVHGTLKWTQVMDIYEEATDYEERSTEPRDPWKPPRRWEQIGVFLRLLLYRVRISSFREPF